MYNREQWLTEAAHLISDELIQPKTHIQKPTFKISVGWPHANKGKHRTIGGQCFPTHMSKSKLTNEIFISPTLDNPKLVLAILTHELIHAYDDCQNGHRGQFAKIAHSIGLSAPLTTITPHNVSDKLSEYLKSLVDILPPFPHDKLNTEGMKKEQSRQLKVYCPHCDFKFRASKKIINQMTLRTCLICQSESLIAEC